MTISVEPGLIETNGLVYALDAEAPRHKASRTLLEAARDGSATIYMTSQILCEFYSIVTNARRVSNPRTAADAVSAIKGLLAIFQVLPIPAHTIVGWLSLLGRRPVTGDDVFDLQIVAAM